jgi:hypothetical protein
VDVFFDRKAGELTLIKINEEPATLQEALARLRGLATKWNWPWNETDYARWAQRAAAGDPTRIGAGDKWNSPLVPRVAASIIPAAGTPDRPWYVQLRVSWSEEAKVEDRQGSSSGSSSLPSAARLRREVKKCRESLISSARA